MVKKIKLKTFNYPTVEERKEIDKEIPPIVRLKVKYKSALFGILEKKDVELSINEEDVYWWNLCLNNRLGKLRETFVYVIVHYKRFTKIVSEEEELKHTEAFLYDYYLEIFYYYFYSTRDILGQFINVLFNMEIEENKIFLNERFTRKIPNDEVRTIFNSFLKETGDSYINYRNAFNHRFTPIHKDNRAKTTVLVNKKEGEIEFGFANDIDRSEFYKDTHKLMLSLSKLTVGLNRLDLS